MNWKAGGHKKECKNPRKSTTKKTKKTVSVWFHCDIGSQDSLTAAALLTLVNNTCANVQEGEGGQLLSAGQLSKKMVRGRTQKTIIQPIL